MSFFDGLGESFRSATKFGNILKRILFFIIFGFFLGFTKLVTSLNELGANGGGFVGLYKAFVKSLYYGLGIAHVTFWNFITLFFTGSNPFKTGQFGSILAGVIMMLLMFAFYFQPISWIINIFDAKGQESTGNKSGQGTSFWFRLAITFIVIFVVSWIVSMSGNSGGSLITEEAINVSSAVDNSSFIVNDSITEGVSSQPSDMVNVIDMLNGGS